MCAGFMGVELSKVFSRMLLDAFLRWDAGTTKEAVYTTVFQRHIYDSGDFFNF